MYVFYILLSDLAYIFLSLLLDLNYIFLSTLRPYVPFSLYFKTLSTSFCLYSKALPSFFFLHNMTFSISFLSTVRLKVHLFFCNLFFKASVLHGVGKICWTVEDSCKPYTRELNQTGVSSCQISGTKNFVPNYKFEFLCFRRDAFTDVITL